MERSGRNREKALYYVHILKILKKYSGVGKSLNQKLIGELLEREYQEKDFHISRQTLSKYLEDLENEGYLIRDDNNGFYVKPILSDFIWEILSIGLARMLEFSIRMSII